MRPVSQLADLGAFSPETPDADALHRQLAVWNHRRLAVQSPHDGWAADLEADLRMLKQEGAFIEAFRRRVAPLAAQAPRDPQGFIAWFEGLQDHGPGLGEAGFEDLVAMTQVKLPARAKLELARNYWDEMGRGAAGGMHGPMLERTVEGLGLTPSIEGTVWPSLCLANVMTAMATTRRYVYQSIGALGVVELTAPGRVACVAEGLKRLGCPPAQRKYFMLHAQLDVEHSRAWNAEALMPLVEETPDCAPLIAEGALMRLLCGEACFETYRAHLWTSASMFHAAA